MTAPSRTRRRAQGIALLAALTVAAGACSGRDGEAIDVRAALRADATATPGGAVPATTGTATGAPGPAAGTTADPATGAITAGAVTTGATNGQETVDDGARSGTAGPDGSAAAGAGSGAAPPGGTRGATTSGTIEIGIGYTANLDAAMRAVGGSNLTGSNWREFIDPLIDWVNRNGGIAGRRVVPVYHTTDPLNGSFEAQAQAACAAWTEDRRVFAVVAMVVAPNLYDCLGRRGVPFLAQSASLTDRTVLNRYPGLTFQPFMITAERLGPWIDDLVRRRWFGTGARAAIVRYDDGVHDRFAAQVLRPRLVAGGVPVVEDIALRVPGSAGEASDLFAQANNAVLRMRAAGVTHVVLSPTGGAIPFALMQTAENQGFRPRYAINSLEVPAFVTQNVPEEQLVGSAGVGWLNASDLHFSEVPKGRNANEDLCWSVTKRNGDEAKRFCDGLFLLRQALDGVARPTAAVLRSRVEALGSRFQSPWTIATAFGPGRYDGASAARPLAYEPSCNCYRYTGPAFAVP